MAAAAEDASDHEGRITAHAQEIDVVIGFEGHGIQGGDHLLHRACDPSQIGEHAVAKILTLNGVGDGVEAVVTDGHPIDAEVNRVGVFVDFFAVVKSQPTAHREDAHLGFDFGTSKLLGASFEGALGHVKGHVELGGERAAASEVIAVFMGNEDRGDIGWSEVELCQATAQNVRSEAAIDKKIRLSRLNQGGVSSAAALQNRHGHTDFAAAARRLGDEAECGHAGILTGEEFELLTHEICLGQGRESKIIQPIHLSYQKPDKFNQAPKKASQKGCAAQRSKIG